MLAAAYKPNRTEPNRTVQQSFHQKRHETAQTRHSNDTESRTDINARSARSCTRVSVEDLFTGMRLVYGGFLNLFGVVWYGGIGKWYGSLIDS